AVADMEGVENALLKSRTDAAQSSSWWAVTTFSAFALLDFVLLLFMYFAIRRENKERKRAEGVLRENEERFRLMVEGVKDYAIFMLDPGGYVVSWNAGAERIKGY